MTFNDNWKQFSLQNKAINTVIIYQMQANDSELGYLLWKYAPLSLTQCETCLSVGHRKIRTFAPGHSVMIRTQFFAFDFET